MNTIHCWPAIKHNTLTFKIIKLTLIAFAKLSPNTWYYYIACIAQIYRSAKLRRMNAKNMNRFNGTAALTVTITSELKTHFVVEQALNVQIHPTHICCRRFWSWKAFSLNQIELERMENVLLYFWILDKEICASGPRGQGARMGRFLQILWLICKNAFGPVDSCKWRKLCLKS